MKSYIPEEIKTSACGTFCQGCQFLVEQSALCFFCTKFDADLMDDHCGGRPIRCTPCMAIVHGSTWATEGP